MDHCTYSLYVKDCNKPTYRGKDLRTGDTKKCTDLIYYHYCFTVTIALIVYRLNLLSQSTDRVHGPIDPAIRSKRSRWLICIEPMVWDMKFETLARTNNQIDRGCIIIVSLFTAIVLILFMVHTALLIHLLIIVYRLLIVIEYRMIITVPSFLIALSQYLYPLYRHCLPSGCIGCLNLLWRIFFSFPQISLIQVSISSYQRALQSSRSRLLEHRLFLVTFTCATDFFYVATINLFLRYCFSKHVLF